MSAKITINIPNISTIIGTYDQIRVYRATNPSGPFEEITNAVESPAIMTGTILEPYNVNGLSLLLSSKTINAQNTTFIGVNPISLINVLSELNTNLTDVIAGNDGFGHIQFTSLGTGSDGRIRIELGSTAAELLGFDLDQLETGKNARINMVQGQTEYVYIDVWGGSQYWYKTDYYNSGSSIESVLSLPEQGQHLIPEPEKLAQHTSPRALCLYRGRSHTFLAEFWNNNDLQDVPLIPSDATKYPSVSIIDINGQIVTNRLAIEIVPGRYSFEWTVSDNAVISNDDRRYKCHWNFIAESGRQLTSFTEFDVKDPDIEPSFEDQAIKQVVLENKNIKFRYVTSHKPYELSCDIIVGNTVIYHALFVDMNMVTYNGNFIYSFIVNNSLYKAGAEIVGIWDILETPISHPQQLHQSYYTIAPDIIPNITSLRMIIDKYRKQKDLPQHYDDGELLEYLYRGANILNAMFPTTNWSYTAFPQPLKAHLFLTSAIYGLNAQGLLETDLNFDFSGQSVTLGYDHSSGLDSAISRMWSWLEAQVPAVKTAFVRSQSAVGITVVTPVNFRYRNRVRRIGNIKNGASMSMDYFNYFSSMGFFM